MKVACLVVFTILLASGQALGRPPERHITTHPFVAPPERAAAIRSNHTKVTVGMTPGEVAAVLGEPDEIRPLYEPIIKNPTLIGYTQSYVIRRLVENGSVNERQESIVRVSFDNNDRVTRVSSWGL